jgi:PKD repeat protein
MDTGYIYSGINVTNNNLSCLHVENSRYLEASNNPNLSCIEVNDTAYANSTSNYIFDTGVIFNINCNNNCSPCDVNADYSSTDNGNGNYSFSNTSTGSFNQSQWAFGDGTTSTQTNPNHTFSANGAYVVVLTVNDSLGGCFDYFMDTIIVTGIPSPAQCVAGFVMYPDTGINNVTVINSSTGSNLSYLWDFGDGNTSTQQFPSHTYATLGNYYLCLTVDDGAGCNDMYCDSIGVNGVVFKGAGFTINVIAPPITTGINNEVISSSDVRIYPNPTSTQLTIDTQLKIDKLTVTDITGKTITSISLKSNVIDVSSLANGIYFIKVEGEGQTIIEKFIKN